ncbi:aminopeptidase [Truepera radiovictrix]|uniref:Peptidase M29 aminopeptidase II n=1 Tax=Truepera radiovictrix (strain DSM 17093 / CIP 108686 / LMG 22925 / RQ-24) TaxID=649638 RepID=D7CR12_TRURR|nr:aminopeptidase [Truepera radiovictrix]ADI13412.1 peptidase M29 aminopeptidase II [Truepera radiovictrix DSM 17093]WMT58025.1 aminopeptidase [Truepera radiovictrix]
MTFDDKLSAYAELITHVGLNLRAGQQLLATAPVEASPLLAKVAEAAYKRGVRYVHPVYNDDGVTLARFRYAPRDSFDLYPSWLARGMLETLEADGARLSVTGNDPDLLKDQDPELIATAQRRAQTELRPFMAKVMNDAVNWCVVAAATPAWAAKVFPDAPEGERLGRLWDAIFRAVRADGPDPVGTWEAHLAALQRRREHLNARRYRALRYRGPGTDLTLGLADGHIWKGGASQSAAGTRFVANLPTEEVFTAPHRARVDGVVASSKPLSYAGQLIEDFSLTFEAGRVVSAKAARGQEALDRLLDTDEGARRLGEVALVPHSSPISQSGLLFYNTLFDENAASHLALGRAYRFCVEGGTTMSDDEAQGVGLNDSLTHVDFMIGSSEMDVDGVREDGAEEPVMRAGEWAF